MKRLSGVLLVVMLVAFAVPAFAQEEDTYIPENEISEEKLAELEKTKDGWYFQVKPGLSASFSDSRKVVGQTDGYTVTFGLNLEAGARMVKGKHEWRNLLAITEAITRTPVIDQFIISADSLKLESVYMYYFEWWVGLYGRFALDTSMFPGYDARPETALYAITRADGTIDFIKDDIIQLTDPFQPLTLKQGLGPFFRPLAKEKVNLEFMLGLGAWETFTEGALALKDNGDTTPIEVATLENVYQVGGESINKLWGELWEKKIAYLVGVEFMMPFYVDPDNSGLSGADLLNVDIHGKLDFRITQWMYLGYELKVIREPQVITDWQVQNNLLLTLTYDFQKYVAD